MINFFGTIWNLLALTVLVTGCHSTRPFQAPGGPNLRMLTYNVNWGAPRPDLAAELIRNSGADIVCLQETTPDWERYVRHSLGAEYPFAQFRNSATRSGGGLAFLSRVAGEEVAYLPSTTGWFDGWIMAFPTPLGSVQVLNVHLRPPISDGGSWVSGYFSTRDDRVREMERFYGGREPVLPILVVGDFNDGEHSRVVEWLEGKGLANALPLFDQRTPTWQWRTAGITLHRRMDHVLYSPELRCCAAQVIRAGASDHFPVLAVFGNCH